jgi:hypothetical protein
MSAEEVLREYAARTGWDLAAMLAVATDYIDELNIDELNIDGLHNDSGSGKGSSGSGGTGNNGEEGFRASVRDHAQARSPRATADKA